MSVIEPNCKMIVVIPVQNEERYIERCIEAFSEQYDRCGISIDTAMFEVHLLINNSSDDTEARVLKLIERFPDMRLSFTSVVFPPTHANVGTARKVLFEYAYERFASAGRSGIIATTDADTRVSEQWIHSTLSAIRDGADAVTGYIEIDRDEFEKLSPRVRSAILLDRKYRMMLEALEAKIDIESHESWPRHYHHTGASLAVTTEAYRLCGGMPDVATHEDIALVRALRRYDARIAHRFDVAVTTSARLQARALHGMGARLSEWSRCEDTERHRLVRHPKAHLEYAQARAKLRSIWRRHRDAEIALIDTGLPEAVKTAIDEGSPFGHVWNIYAHWLRKTLASYDAVPIDEAVQILGQICSADRGNDGIGGRLAQIHRQISM